MLTLSKNTQYCFSVTMFKVRWGAEMPFVNSVFLCEDWLWLWLLLIITVCNHSWRTCKAGRQAELWLFTMQMLLSSLILSWMTLDSSLKMKFSAMNVSVKASKLEPWQKKILLSASVVYVNLNTSTCEDTDTNVWWVFSRWDLYEAENESVVVWLQTLQGVIVVETNVYGSKLWFELFYLRLQPSSCSIYHLI